VNNFTAFIAQDLEFDMVRFFDEFFEVDVGVTEGFFRFHAGGEESFDEDGDQLTFQWTLEEGAEAVALDDATSETPRFTASTQGEYVFSLQVFDGIALSAPDRVQVIFDPLPGSDDDADDDDDTAEPDEGDDDEDEEDGGCCG